MDYEAILKMIREQNPKMSFREAQKKASEKYNRLKEAREELASDKIPKLKVTVPLPAQDAVVDTKKQKKGTKEEEQASVLDAKPISLIEGISVNDLFDAEKAIRKEGASRNSIINHGRKVIPNGKLVVHGVDGANKLVSWEDDEGNALPISGYFKIFLT